MLPDRLIFKNSAPFRLMPLIGFFPLVITVTALAGLLLEGKTPVEELVLPGVAMGGISLSIMLLFGLLTVVLNALERRSIRRVYADPWATWPQFASLPEYHAFAEAERERELRHARFNWGGLIVVVIVLLGVGAYSAYMLSSTGSDGGPAVFLALGGFGLILFTIIAGGPLLQRRAARARHRRRLAATTIPNALIGTWGVYDEDTGFESLRGLQNVRFDADGGSPARPPGIAGYFPGRPRQAGKWPQVVFTVRRYARYHSYTVTIPVRVPPASEAEARALAQDFEQ